MALTQLTASVIEELDGGREPLTVLGHPGAHLAGGSGIGERVVAEPGRDARANRRFVWAAERRALSKIGQPRAGVPLSDGPRRGERSGEE